MPRAALRRTTAPCPGTSLSRTDVVPDKAAEGFVKGCGWHGMQGGLGPVPIFLVIDWGKGLRRHDLRYYGSWVSG
jgi:hypothetical protein